MVDQDKGRTPQGSNGNPQIDHQETTAMPANSAAIGPAATQPNPATSVNIVKAPVSQPVSPSPTASKENEELQVHSGSKAEDVHAIALKACASETAAREPMLSPTRVLLKG